MSPSTGLSNILFSKYSRTDKLNSDNLNTLDNEQFLVMFSYAQDEV